MAIDISQANEATSKDVLALSARPVLITCAGCEAIRPPPRNRRGEALKAVADEGGVGADSAWNARDMTEEEFCRKEEYPQKTGVAAPGRIGRCM